MKRALIILSLVWGMPVVSLASMAQDYQSAQADIAQQHVADKLKKSLDSKILPVTLDVAPQESRYYTNPQSIEHAAALKADDENEKDEKDEKDSLSTLVRQQVLARPKIFLSPQAPELKTAKEIQAHASAIVDGTYADCTDKTIQQTHVIEKTCETETSFDFNCVKSLHVEVNEKEVPEIKTIALRSHTHLNGSPSGAIQVDPSEGVVTSLSFYVHDSSNPWLCDRSYGLKVNGVLLGWYHGQCGHYLGELSFGRGSLNIPFKSHTIHLSLLGGVLQGSVSGSVTYTTTVKKKIAEKNWLSSCSHLPTQCHLTKTDCLSPKATREIDGVLVQSDCWQLTENYHCGGQPSTSCLALANQGCSQLTSTCLTYDQSFCTLEKQTWQCPIENVTGHGIQCGEKFYCMDGSCQQTEKSPNKDFGSSAAALSDLNEVGKEVNKQKVTSSSDMAHVELFAGKVAECAKDAAGVDCCANKGWGKDILGTCTEQEKNLGQARVRGVAIAAGGYCKHKEAGICVDWRNRYCIFTNKLAFDVQRYGRADQLGISFGEKNSTNCRGLTPQELSRIDFKRIDFSNIAQDLKYNQHTQHLPDSRMITKNNQTAVKKAQNSQDPILKAGLSDDE